MENNENKDQGKKLDKFLGQKPSSQECQGEECLIKNNGELIERIEKKYITPDGKQLLI
jgi:hypothetical protein